MLSTKNKIILASFISRFAVFIRSALGLNNICTVQRRDINWCLDLNEGIDLSIWLFGYFERKNLREYEKIIRHGDVVIDIGANIGSHTLPLAKLVGNGGTIIAIEPTNWAYQKLIHNLTLNPTLATRVKPLHGFLLSNEQEKPAMEIYSSWPLNQNKQYLHKLHCGSPKGTEGAFIKSLDSLVIELNLSKIDLIKLDVDGHELSVLKGMINVLSKFKPLIMMELAPYVLMDDDEFSKLIDFITLLKYRIYALDTRSPLPIITSEIMKLIPKNGAINILAKPFPTSQRGSQ